MSQENDALLSEQYPERRLEDGRVIPGWLVVLYWKDRFLGWETSGKKPRVYNVNHSDFHMSLSFEWGPYSSVAASAHMHLAKEYGSNLGPTVTPQEIIKGNALGDNGEELDLDQILEKFALQGMDPETDSHFGVIKMERLPTEEEVKRGNEWRRQMFEKSIERQKRTCEEAGFPFD